MSLRLIVSVIVIGLLMVALFALSPPRLRPVSYVVPADPDPLGEDHRLGKEGGTIGRSSVFEKPAP